MTNTVIFFSSANPHGNTFLLTQAVLNSLKDEQVRYFNLDALNFADYNYANDYPQDHFYDMAKAIDWADNLVFASPNYWHSVTSNMKRLIDRITELTENPQVKPIGKRLKNKRGFVVMTSSVDEACSIFTGMFDKLFAYFDMHSAGVLHVNCRDGFKLPEQQLNDFNSKLMA